MSTNFVDEYLVKLGATVDQSGMQKFYQALKEASVVTEASASGIAGAMGKAALEVVGGFAAMGVAALGLIDKVAMADQSYRLFALHMYMSKDAARSLKVAMDALGEPLENLTWDKELRGRTHQLIQDQRTMAPNGDFEAQMRKVRDIRFEFTRMEVEAQYLAMHVVQDFLTALGIGPDKLLTKLHGFNDWITHNLPRISGEIVKFVTDMKPLWDDTKMVFYSLEDALKEATVAFVNFMGVLTGDDSLSDSNFDMDKLGKAMHYVGDGAMFAAHAVALMAKELAQTITLVADFASAIMNLQVYNWHPGVAWDSAKKGVQDAADLGHTQVDLASSVVGLAARYGKSSGTSNDSSDAHSLIDKFASSLGVDPSLAHAVATTESGENQNATSTTGARGIMQLTRATAKALGVNREDASDNVRGGVSLLAQLLKHYGGNAAYAVGAYHDGQGAMDRVLAGKATISTEGRSEIAAVMRRMGTHGDVQVGSITIHIDKKNATNEDVGNAVVAKLRVMQNKRTQRNLAEFQDLSPSY